MTFESPALVRLLVVLVPLALPVLLALIYTRLLNFKTGYVPLAVMAAVGVLPAFGVSAFLDAAGKTVSGEVLDKRELLVYHLDGSWTHKLVADIRYTSLSTNLATTEALSLLPARYDELHQGDFVPLRCANLPDVFRITRLEDQATMPQFLSWATDQPFLCLFVIGLMLLLAARFIVDFSLPMLSTLSAIVTVGAWWMSSVGIPLWQQSDLHMSSLNTVSAIVREIHPPYLGSGFQGWIATSLFTPYDLILLDLVPLGRSQTVLTVDMVDFGSASLRPGQTINVEYSPGNPRFSIVPDVTRGFFWKNALIGTFFASLALLPLARFAFVLFKQHREASAEAQAAVMSDRR
jgi:hypothetical protein